MKVRPLTSREGVRWNRWLFIGPGIRLDPGASLHRLEGEFTLYGLCVTKLMGLRIWLDRDNPDPLIQFEIAPQRSVLCRIFGQRFGPLQSRRQLETLTQRLKATAEAGRVWWGTESLTDPPWLTTLLCCTHRPLLPKAPAPKEEP